MTKYILHGGETGIPNGHNEAFYQEWLKYFELDIIPTILLVYFARPSEDWEKLANKDQERLGEYTGNRLVNLVVASSDMAKFIEQIKIADVVYFRGGSTEKLMSIVLPIKDKLIELLDHKICVGSSAGVMMLVHSTRSNSTDWDKGFGLLPINCFVHYSAEWQENLNAFKNNNLDNNFEYLLLPETEFVVREY